MQIAKRVAALLMAIMLLCAMTACDTGTSSLDGSGALTDPGNGQTPAEAVAAAMERMAEVKSVDAVMEMEMEMTAGEESLRMTTTMDMTTFLDPLKLRADMTISMGELGSMDMAVYAQGEGEQYTMYVYDGTTWTAQSVALSALEQYSAQSSMEIYMSGAVDFTEDGSETLSGRTADKYTGVIRGESLEEVLSASGAVDSLESAMGSDAGTLADFYTDLGDLPVTVWIDQESGYPVRFSMDMSDIMEKLVSGLGEAAEIGLQITGMTLEVTYDNFDQASDFAIPEEALNVA